MSPLKARPEICGFCFPYKKKNIDIQHKWHSFVDRCVDMSDYYLYKNKNHNPAALICTTLWSMDSKKGKVTCFIENYKSSMNIFLQHFLSIFNILHCMNNRDQHGREE